METEDRDNLWNVTKRSLERGDFSLLDDLLAEEDVSILDLLDENAAEQKYFDEALTWACFTGRTEEAKELLDRGVDPAAGLGTGMAAFHWAANRGNLDTVQLLIDRRAPLEQLNAYDGTVLNCTLWAAVNEHRDSHASIIDALVKAGAEIENGTLEWWEEQGVPSSVTKARVAETLRTAVLKQTPRD